jgi:hypothetical protein
VEFCYPEESFTKSIMISKAPKLLEPRGFFFAIKVEQIKYSEFRNKHKILKYKVNRKRLSPYNNSSLIHSSLHSPFTIKRIFGV